ncbi:hypothetical protein Trydic_g6255 [Trypoxylus dichotomus]
MSKEENDDTENLNFELVSGEHSRSSSGDGDDNSEDDADDVGNPTIASTSGYATPKAKRAYEAKGTSWKDVTVDEFVAFCSLHIHARVNKALDVPMKELFCGEFANRIYRITMFIFRFMIIELEIRIGNR